MSDKFTLTESGLILALVPVVVALITGWLALVFMLLWGWYAVPLGAPALSFFQAFGVLLIVRVATLSVATKKTDPNEMMTFVSNLVLSPLLLLVTGWIGSFFI